VGKKEVQVLYDANNLVFMAARLPQIYSNFRAKSTGHLSLMTFIINVCGCLARIFTSMVIRAPAMVRAYTISESELLAGPFSSSSFHGWMMMTTAQVDDDHDDGDGDDDDGASQAGDAWHLVMPLPCRPCPECHPGGPGADVPQQHGSAAEGGGRGKEAEKGQVIGWSSLVG
jgi:hypothetical protein